MGWNVDMDIKVVSADHQEQLEEVRRQALESLGSWPDGGEVSEVECESPELASFRWTFDNYKNLGDSWLRQLSREHPRVAFYVRYIKEHETEGFYILMAGEESFASERLWPTRIIFEHCHDLAVSP